MTISTIEARKHRRLQLRATAQDESLIKVAAERQGVTVTDFILNAARERAEQALSDRTTFVLNSKKWRQFMAALDHPPQNKPRLRKLFHEPHVVQRRP